MGLPMYGMDNTVTLNCILKGRIPSKHAFPIKINKDETVGMLKDIIRNSHLKYFAHVNVTSLSLWKISVPFDRDDEIQKLNFHENDELLAIMDIGDYWKEEEIHKKHIHVFVSCK